MSRTWLVIGLSLVVSGLAVSKARADPPQAPALGLFIMSSPVTANDVTATSPRNFGISLAIDHDTAIVLGEVEHSASFGAVAGAYIFQRRGIGNDWYQVQRLRSSDGNVFNRGLAIAGDLALVAGTRSVMVFERNKGGANNWGQVATLRPSDPAVDIDFPSSLALAGETAVVGSLLTVTHGPSGDVRFGPGSVYLFDRNSGGPDAWGQSARLQVTSASCRCEDEFGWSVSASGRTIVVGGALPFDTGDMIAAGAAYVFEQAAVNGPWTKTATLTVPQPGGNPFPFTVATDGAHALVQTGDVVRTGSGGGSVHVFGRNQGGPDAWGHITRLAVDDLPGMPFPQQISIANETAVVSLRVFRQHQGGVDHWGAVGTLPVSTIAPIIAAGGDTVVVGDVTANDNTGVAWFFALDSDGDGIRDDADGCPLNPEHSIVGDPCQPQAPPLGPFIASPAITANDVTAGSQFGLSVAIDHDTAVVGAVGAAYIFQRSAFGNDWHQVQRLTSSAASAFGGSVAISGDLAIVSTPGLLGVLTTGPHVAILFERNRGGANNWGQVATLQPSDPTGVMAFGYRVALAGETAVVASPVSSGVGPSGNLRFGPGAVYLFDRNSGGPDAWGQSARLQIVDPVDPLSALAPPLTDVFGNSIAASGRTIIVGAVLPAQNEHTNGVAYVFEQDVNGPWTRTATLTVRQTLFDGRSYDVATDGVNALIRTGRNTENGPSVWVFGRNQGGPDAWGRVARLAIDPTGAPSQSMSIANGIAVAAETSSSGPFLSRLFRQQQGGANAWGAVGTLRIATPGAPLGPVASSGDTVVAGDASADNARGAVRFFALDYDGDGIRDETDGCPLNPEHSIVGDPCQRTSAGYAGLDSHVSMLGFTTSVQNGLMQITATFVNHGIPARNPFFVVTELSGGNRVVSDGGESGVGATVTPDVGDGVWQTDEPATAVFLIRLVTNNPFRFLVSTRGDTNPQ